MNREFQDVDVLLDAHDLSLPNGTGIKSYGLNLITALKDLGATPELLVSARTHKDPVVSRAMIYDPAARQERPIHGKYNLHKQRILFPRRVAKHVPAGGTFQSLPVPDTIFPFGLGCSSLFNCYRTAYTLQQRFEAVQTFRTAKKYRIWHSTMPLPLRHESATQITTIHDLIPLMQPHLVDELRPMFHQRVADALEHSRMIAVDSIHTKNDVLNYFKVAEEKLVVAHPYSHRAPVVHDEQTMELAMKSMNLKAGKYILHVGTVEKRKNIRRLIEAYLRINSDHKLVLLGKPGYGQEEELQCIRFLKKRKGQDVHLADYMPDMMVSALFQGATCLAMPSLYEGFGLPVLEAMKAGCPVVCSNTTSLPEVGGNAVHYIDPLSVESIAAGLQKVIGDAEYRASLAERGRVQAQKFSKEHFSTQITELYSKALA